MPATAVPSALRADKALVRQISDFDDKLESAEDFMDLSAGAAAKAAIRKDVAALRGRMKATLADTDKAAVQKAVAVLVKDAKKANDAAFSAMVKDTYDRYVATLQRARALMAQAMVEVGQLEPQALRMPLQKEQAALRAELDKFEKRQGDVSALGDLQAQLPMFEAFVKKIASVAPAGQWMRANYMPLVARVQAAIKRVPTDRCRKTLLAELDFIEVDTNKALLKGDAKAVQARSAPQLQRIEKLAVQIVAVSPALDRELARLAKITGAAGDAQAASAKKLKAMIQAKASSWPVGADADAIASALTAFESALAKLAAEIDKGQKAPAKA